MILPERGYKVPSSNADCHLTHPNWIMPAAVSGAIPSRKIESLACFTVQPMAKGSLFFPKREVTRLARRDQSGRRKFLLATGRKADIGLTQQTNPSIASAAKRTNELSAAGHPNFLKRSKPLRQMLLVNRFFSSLMCFSSFR
jgi:hypothetical protein